MNWRKPADYEYTKGLTPELWAWEFLRRNSGYRADWESYEARKLEEGDPPYAELATKWGVEALVDPASRSPRRLRFSPPTYGGAYVGQRRVETTLPPGKLLYAFDLTIGLKRQIEKAGQDLRLFQEMEQRMGSIGKARKPRRHVAKWTLYLRLLDARDEGAAHAEIAGEIYPDLANEYPELRASKKVANQVGQAARIVNGAYRDILLGQV